MVIYKYPLRTVGWIQIDMPGGAEVIHVGEQAGTICLWAKVQPHAPLKRRTFHVAATGETIDPEARFVGTALIPADLEAWHVFEVTR